MSIKYIKNELFIEGLSARKIAELYGTPAYIYSKELIVNNFNNLFVNPAWNHGVKIAKNDHILLLNDDVICFSHVLDKVHSYITHNTIGILSIKTLFANDISFCPIDVPIRKHIEIQIESTTRRQGWFMLMKKTDYIDIPENILIWYGDDWLYNKVVNLNHKTVTSHHIYHFESSTVKKIDRLSDITTIDQHIFHSIK